MTIFEPIMGREPYGDYSTLTMRTTQSVDGLRFRIYETGGGDASIIFNRDEVNKLLNEFEESFSSKVERENWKEYFQMVGEDADGEDIRMFLTWFDNKHVISITYDDSIGKTKGYGRKISFDSYGLRRFKYNIKDALRSMN